VLVCILLETNWVDVPTVDWVGSNCICLVNWFPGVKSSVIIAVIVIFFPVISSEQLADIEVYVWVVSITGNTFLTIWRGLFKTVLCCPSLSIE